MKKHLVDKKRSVTRKGNTVLSLFSSAGIGELGVKAAGFDIVVSNELLVDRCALYAENYPDTEIIQGDIWDCQQKIVTRWEELVGESPFLVYATPPCQGMSSNGTGKLLAEIRSGRRGKEDPRNRLIIPTIQIIKRLRPLWVLLENVPTMEHTIIRTPENTFENIITYIAKELSPEYVGRAEVVNCADYGIPQVRNRLITIFTRSPKGMAHLRQYGTLLPKKTHSENGGMGLLPWVTLRQAIGDLPTLDAKEGCNSSKDIPWHVVPILSDEKYWWVSQTPKGETAYNNQCPNPKCRYKKNKRHGSNFADGIHQSRKDTPIFCEKCGALLPRPTIMDKTTHSLRLIKGFDTAYRRMLWDKPAPTLTQNLQFVSSDKKLHPEQNRVLSIYEGLRIQTITDYPYELTIGGQPIARNMCCEIIGESVPPRLIEIICKQITSVEKEKLRYAR